MLERWREKERRKKRIVQDPVLREKYLEREGLWVWYLAVMGAR